MTDGRGINLLDFLFIKTTIIHNTVEFSYFEIENSFNLFNKSDYLRIIIDKYVTIIFAVRTSYLESTQLKELFTLFSYQ